MKIKNENVIAMAIFHAIVMFLPLFMENRYFNIVEAKAHMLTLIFTAALLLILLECVITKGRCIASQKLNALDIAVILAGSVALISCVCSESFKTTFFGQSGWGIGGLILLSFSAVYLFLSRNILLTDKSRLPAFVTACVIAFICVMQSADVNVLDMHTGITRSQHIAYKSTLGNINAHVGYACLLTPAALIAFINEKRRQRTVVEFIFLLAMLCEICFACTDGIYLGLGLCAFLVIPHIFGSTQRARRTCLAVATYGALLLLSRCGCFAYNSSFNGISGMFHSLKVSLPMTAVGSAGYVLLLKYPKAFENKRISRICVIILEVLLTAVVLYCIVLSALNFSDEWGSSRGILWRVSIEAFSEQPFGRKLIGIGPEMQKEILVESLQKRIFVCHSEPIQILLTMGIAGLAAWFAVYGAAIYNMLRRKIWKTEKLMYALPIIAYMGQSLLYSAMATNVGILCVLLASYRNMCYDEQRIQNTKNMRKKR